MKIKVYTTPTCAFCLPVKKVLDEKGVEYEEIDITQDEKAAEELKEKTGQMGVPVTIIGDEVVIGYDKKKLEELLQK